MILAGRTARHTGHLARPARVSLRITYDGHRADEAIFSFAKQSTASTVSGPAAPFSSGNYDI